MIVAMQRQSRVGPKLVCRDRGRFFHVRDNVGNEARALHVWHNTGHDRAAAFDHAEYSDFMGRSATATFARAASADHRFVNLNVARERSVAVYKAKVLSDLMTHAPCRFVIHGQLALQFFGGNTVAGRGEQVHGVKPLLQGNMGLLERRSHHRVNVVATCTGVSRHLRELLKFARIAATGALVIRAKALLEQVLKAGVVVWKKLHEFGDWHGLGHGGLRLCHDI